MISALVIHGWHIRDTWNLLHPKAPRKTTSDSCVIDEGVVDTLNQKPISIIPSIFGRVCGGRSPPNAWFPPNTSQGRGCVRGINGGARTDASYKQKTKTRSLAWPSMAGEPSQAEQNQMFSIRRGWRNSRYISKPTHISFHGEQTSLALCNFLPTVSFCLSCSSWRVQPKECMLQGDVRTQAVLEWDSPFDCNEDVEFRGDTCFERRLGDLRN